MLTTNFCDLNSFSEIRRKEMCLVWLILSEEQREVPKRAGRIESQSQTNLINRLFNRKHAPWLELKPHLFDKD